jgi:hypothetical protein
MPTTGFLKNFLRQHFIGPLTIDGGFDEDNLVKLARGISTIEPEASEETENFQYYDLEGGIETEVTSSSLSHSFSGNRFYGDPALEFVRNMLTNTNDRKCSFRVIEPDGRILEGVATITEIMPYGGDANTRATLGFTATFVGMPLDAFPLPVPTGLAYTLDGTDVVLTWTPTTDTNVDHYRVLRDGTFLSIANTTASYTDSTSVAGETYEYTVQSSNWLNTNDHQDILDGLVTGEHVDSDSSAPLTVTIPTP